MPVGFEALPPDDLKALLRVHDTTALAFAKTPGLSKGK